jgi:hypothetical protein
VPVRRPSGGPHNPAGAVVSTVVDIEVKPAARNDLLFIPDEMAYAEDSASELGGPLDLAGRSLFEKVPFRRSGQYEFTVGSRRTIEVGTQTFRPPHSVARILSDAAKVGKRTENPRFCARLNLDHPDCHRVAIQLQRMGVAGDQIEYYHGREP